MLTYSEADLTIKLAEELRHVILDSPKSLRAFWEAKLTNTSTLPICNEQMDIPSDLMFTFVDCLQEYEKYEAEDARVRNLMNVVTMHL